MSAAGTAIDLFPKQASTWNEGVLSWDDGDAVCISVVFTYQLPEAREKAYAIQGMFKRKVRMGGPAVRLFLRSNPEYLKDCGATAEDYPGVLQMYNPMATRTSEGCIRMCEFCSVPIIEGLPVLEKTGKRQRELRDWPDLPLIADNNLLANSIEHFDRVCDRLERHSWCDFNQGVDPRILNEHHAERIARLKKATVRLALDHPSLFGVWEESLERLLRAGVPRSRIRSYVLCAWKWGVDVAWKVCEFVEKHGIKPLPQWFHELDTLEHNIVTETQKALGWNDYERRRLMQWFFYHKRAVQ